MSNQLLEREAVTVTETTPEVKVNHITCHCDMDTAWCGKDITEEVDDVAEPLDCALCALVVEQHLTDCPWGCECTCEMNLFFCGECTCPGDEDVCTCE